MESGYITPALGMFGLIMMPVSNLIILMATGNIPITDGHGYLTMMGLGPIPLWKMGV
jgi:hypothetical protein